MNTQLIVRNQIDDKLDLIKRTVAKGATNDELEMFITLAKKYNLDPFAKEIWFIKYGEKQAPSIFTSRDGYLKIAHESGQFDGMESYTIDDEKGNPVKAVCAVYRKDMTRPFKAEIKVVEYKQNNQVWNKYTSAMAIKVAENFALKRAFNISGLITKEEMDDSPPAGNKYRIPIETKEDSEKARNASFKTNSEDYVYPFEDISEVFEAETIKPEAVISDAQRNRLYAIAGNKKWSDAQIHDYLEAVYKFKSVKDITKSKYEEICNVFETHGPHWQTVEGQTSLIEEDSLISLEEKRMIVEHAKKYNWTVPQMKEAFKKAFKIDGDICDSLKKSKMLDVLAYFEGTAPSVIGV